MFSHYFEISLNERLNPASLFGKILYRIHGYNSVINSTEVAIDFPKWENSKKFMSASLGNTMRVIGTPDSLSGVLTKTGLMQFLIEDGINILGVQEIPLTQTFAKVQRNNKISKYYKLLAKPGSLSADKEDSSKITDEHRETAEKFSITPEQVMVSDRIYQELRNQERESPLIKVWSKSGGSEFKLHISRIIVSTDDKSHNFSSYGLSLKESSVPVW